MLGLRVSGGTILVGSRLRVGEGKTIIAAVEGVGGGGPDSADRRSTKAGFVDGGSVDKHPDGPKFVIRPDHLFLGGCQPVFGLEKQVLGFSHSWENRRELPISNFLT